MPLSATNFVAKGPVEHADLLQFYNLFTGAMSDQPVTLPNTLSVGGSQGTTTVPLKLYGAVGQSGHLIDLYVDHTQAQPGFGFSALGGFAWGPGGAAPQDTSLSRIATQLGHASDTAGLLIAPMLEVSGNVVAHGNVSFPSAARIYDGGGGVLASSALHVVGTLSVDSTLSVGSTSHFAGDVTVTRGNNTGYVWLGDGAARYLGFDATEFIFVGAPVVVSGQSLTAATLTSSGAISASNTYYFGGLGSGSYWQWNGSAIATPNGVWVGGLQMPNNVELYWNDTNHGISAGSQNYMRLSEYGASWQFYTPANGDYFNLAIVSGALQLQNKNLSINNGNVSALGFYLPTAQNACLVPSTRSGANSGEAQINSYLNVPGDIYSGTYVHGISFISTSDPTVKSNMTALADSDCTLRIRNPQMTVYSYQPDVPLGGYPAPTPTDIGFSAPDVYATNAEFAALDAGGNAVGVDYSHMAAVLWGALRDLDARCQAHGI